jgi:hypothetical protein
LCTKKEHVAEFWIFTANPGYQRIMEYYLQNDEGKYLLM